MDFQLSVESFILPAWFVFERLPIHLFGKSSLFPITSSNGRFLKLDEPTANSRPIVAQVCVELDFLKFLPSCIWIRTGTNKGFWQHIKYENFPSIAPAF